MGSTITIRGTNFTGATAVRISEINVQFFTVVSATEITAVIPLTAVSGTVQVVTPAGIATSSQMLTVTAAGATSVRQTQSAALSDAVKVYPNPTQGAFTLEYTLTAASDIAVEIVDVLGTVVWKHALGRIEAGAHRHTVETSLPAGSYQCRLQAGAHTQTTMFHIVR